MLDQINSSKMPLSEHIFQLLRHRIISLQPGYCPGDQLNADQIAKELDISKTPVVQAIQRLSFYNLVAIEPRKGTYVRHLDDQEVYDLFQFMGQLELISVRTINDLFPDSFLDGLSKLVDKAEAHFRNEELDEYLESDFQFHREVGCMSHNKKIQETYIAVQNQIYLASALKALHLGDAPTALAQHRELIEVYRTRDVEKIAAAIVEHWEDSYRRYQVADPVKQPQPIINE